MSSCLPIIIPRFYVDEAGKLTLVTEDDGMYVLELLYETDFLSKEEFDSLYNDCCELSKILTVIVKSSRD